MEFQDYEIINGRKVVKKHVAAIHCSGKLTLMERKIANVLLYKALPELTQKKSHQITLEELKRLLGKVTRNHELLKKSIKTLISTVIEWNLCDDNLPNELEGWNASSFLAGVSIKQGLVTYEYSETIKSLLANPEIYGQVNLAIQARFKSSYALALYENCSRYRKVGITKQFELTLFRVLMGVKEGTYQQFDQLNKRVITQAVNEINTASDIRVNPIFKRQGRKVIAIQFEIEEQKVMKRLGAVKDAVSIDNKIGLNSEILKKNIDQHGKKKVQNIINYISESAIYKKGEIKNKSGYFIRLINMDNIQLKQDGKVDKPPREITQEEIEKRLWEDKFQELSAEIDHWKRMQHIAVRSGNAANERHYQEIIDTKTDLLKEHLKFKNVIMA